MSENETAPVQCARPSLNNKTKIVATTGPASHSIDLLRELVIAGVDVFRINFSHGSHDEHRQTIDWIRQLGREMNQPFGILGDLSGPKLRIGEVVGGEYAVKQGDTIRLTSEPADGSNGRFQVNFSGFHEVTRPDEQVLLDDGLIGLRVQALDGADVICRLENDGVIKPHKGVNLPQTQLPIPALTKKDKADLKFAVENDVDMLALSFVRSPKDIELARAEVTACGGRMPIIAKIEKAEAVRRFVHILQIADGAMVARGDLGIEVPIEKMPTIQKRIIQLCNLQAKPVITATQMLDSMIRNPRPTRAEATDIYNAIHDGTDAVMLSGETASGMHPVEAVKVMNKIARQAEIVYPRNLQPDVILDSVGEPSITRAVCHAAVRMAEQLKLDCIIAPTNTGLTARTVSQFRPSIPIFACSRDFNSVNSMTLCWGLNARIMEPMREDEVRLSEADALVNTAVRSARIHGFVRAGKRALVLGGLPLGMVKETNFTRIVMIE